MQISIGVADSTLWQTTGFSALQDIASGTAAAYDREYHERLEVLKTSTEPDIVFIPYQHIPQTIYVGDYGGESSNVNNQALAAWFGFNSIVVDYSWQEE